MKVLSIALSRVIVLCVVLIAAPVQSATSTSSIYLRTITVSGSSTSSSAMLEAVSGSGICSNATLLKINLDDKGGNALYALALFAYQTARYLTITTDDAQGCNPPVISSIQVLPPGNVPK